MFTVLIAEDEQKSSQLIQQLIPWSELDLELLGICGNGKTALEAICRHHPSIVITDIRMPEMDGIELVQQVRQRSIPCEFIILSGYRQFEYAQSAVHFNVSEYLLKPVQQSALVSALGTVIRKCERAGLPQRERSVQGIPALYTSFMEQYTSVGFSDIASECINYGLNLRSGLFQVLILQISQKVNAFHTEADQVLSDAVSTLSPLCYEVIPYKKEPNQIFILCNYDTSAADKVSAVLHRKLSKTSAAVAGIGIGAPQTSATMLSEALLTAFYALRCSLQGHQRLCFYIDVYSPASPESTSVISDVEIQKLSNCVEQLDAPALDLELRQMLSKLDINTVPGILKAFFTTVTELLASLVESAVPQISKAEALNKVSITDLCLSYILTGHAPALFPWCEQLIKDAKAEKLRMGSRPIYEARLYIDQHCSQQLSLDEVASHVHLSPSYFSTIFKRETGQTFSDYVTLRRIHAAKQLLRNSKLSIAEVGESVGYADNCYFSRIFTKIVGCKPSQYRKFH